MYTCTLCVHMIPSVPYSKMMTAELWCPLYRTLFGDWNIPIEKLGKVAAPYCWWSMPIELWLPQINKSRVGPDSVFCLPWLQLEWMKQGKSETKQLLPTWLCAAHVPQGRYGSHCHQQLFKASCVIPHLKLHETFITLLYLWNRMTFANEAHWFKRTLSKQQRGTHNAHKDLCHGMCGTNISHGPTTIKT